MEHKLTDSFGRKITYLRLSVTDRCDLRCAYCMAEKMTFLPRQELLTLEELEGLASIFIARGVRRIRLTGGEPLVRRDIMKFIRKLSMHLKRGALDEITLTTNGTQLSKYAYELKSLGVERVNISLDTLNSDTFSKLTRRAVLDQVLLGIDTALSAGLKVKINTVALNGVNREEIPDLIRWAHSKQMNLTLIEVMPMGEIDENRVDQYLPMTAVKDDLKEHFTMIETPLKTGGPARYSRVQETGGILGFISPLTNNFCAGCNRIRVTCTGQIYMCLGHADRVDLRHALRSENAYQSVSDLLDGAIENKPERHSFEIIDRDAAPSVDRHMSVTGG